MPDGRFAPSPTGTLHLGNLRTALLAWLFARSSGSRFLLRFEDLDPGPVRPEYYASQRDDLGALGLGWDAELRQSTDRQPYADAIDRLVAEGRTYPCYCTRREVLEAAAAPHGDLPEGAYPGICRTLTRRERAAREAAGRRPALRLRAGGARVRVRDRRHGEIEGVVDDLVLRRADGTPAYNLAVVVDDARHGIGEVVRGDDLLTSTPRQAFLASLLGVAAPAYAHVPLVLGPDGRRLAKRHGAVTLADRARLGESPADVLARLARSLGLAAPGERVDAGLLLGRFDPDRLPTEPWVVGPAGP